MRFLGNGKEKINTRILKNLTITFSRRLSIATNFVSNFASIFEIARLSSFNLAFNLKFVHILVFESFIQ